MRNGYLSEIFVSFQGEGLHAGRRHLFIRLSGCNLRCRYCDTPDSLERERGFTIQRAEGTSDFISNPISSPELLGHINELLREAGSVDGTALTGGEPLLQSDFLAVLLDRDCLPRPVLLETSGVLPDRLQDVLPLVDIVSMDLKIPSNTGEADFWESHRRFLSLAAGKVYVKILVEAETAPNEVEIAAQLVRTTAPQTPVFVQPITTPQGKVEIDGRSLDAFYTIVRESVPDTRVLPQMHKIIGVR